MADVATAILTRLTAHAGTLALVSTRAWHARLPDDPDYPAVTVQKISETTTRLMGDDSEKELFRVQVGSWASTRAGVVALDVQVKDALQRYSGTVAGVTVRQVFLETASEAYEDGIEQWRIDRDVMVWCDA